MTTERIDIVVREDGSRVVRRNLEDIGASAQKSAGGVDFLKKALAGLGGVLVVRELLTLMNTFETLQNRLRSTGLEGEALTGVYRALLQVSNETRSSVEGSIELYSRLAVSSKELGVSQQQLIDFTKSLNQAILLSGASAQEAQAGIIQLSQGIASGTLRGDELRSVLEQLPAVADVIAKSLKVTRGELRKLGEDGKITAQTVLRAFQEARGELDQRFAKSVPTLSQSFQVLRNNVLDFIGRLDSATGASQGISRALLLVANNLDQLAAGFARLLGTVAAFALAYGTLRTLLAAQAFAGSVAAALELNKAVAAGTVVMLGSAEAERQRAVAALASATAQEAATVATSASSVAAARATVVNVEAQAALVAATQAGLVVAREEQVARLAQANANIAAAKSAQAAAQAAGAQSFALATLRTATAELAVAEAARSAVLKELTVLGAQQARVTAAATAAATASAAAQGTLAQAQAGAAAANAAAAANTAKASTAAATAAAAAAGTTSLFGQALGKLQAVLGSVFSRVGALFVLLNANPFTVLATALVAVIGLLAVWGDKIDAGIDGVTSMLDVLRTLGNIGKEAFGALVDAVAPTFTAILDAAGSAINSITGLTQEGVLSWLQSYADFYSGVGTGFAGIVRAVARTFDAVGGLVTGLVLAVGRAFGGLPDVATNAFKQLYNGAIDIVQQLINDTITAINKARSLVGMSAIDLVQFDKLTVDDNALKKYGESIATSLADGFQAQGGFLENAVNSLFDRVQSESQTRARELLRQMEGKTVPDLNKKTTAAKPPVDQKELEKAQNALRSLLNTILPSSGAVLELAKAQRVLNEAQKMGLITGEQNQRYLALAKRYYQDIIDPLGKYDRELNEQADLLQTNNREREIEAEILRVTKDLQQQGIDLTDKEITGLREKLTVMRDLNELTAAQDSLLANSVDQRRAFATQLEAVNKLLANPASGFTKADANSAIVNAAPDLFAGTQQAVDAQLSVIRDGYAKIDALRKADLISDATAQQMRVQTAEALSQKLVQAQVQAANLRLELGTGSWADSQLAALARVTEGFTTFAAGATRTMGDFFASFTDGFANSVGRSIVYAENLGDAVNRVAKEGIANLISSLVKLGIQWVVNAVLGQTLATAAAGTALALTTTTAAATAAAWAPAAALASLATLGANAAPAAAALVSTTALSEGLALAGMAGFKEGGYTGAVGVNEVAGVVHGREFVVNSEATARNRAALEAMNSGATIAGGTQISVQVQNYGTSKDFQVEQLSPTQIRIIARDEAESVVASRAGRVVAAELNDPNSMMSKSVARNTQTARRRN